MSAAAAMTRALRRPAALTAALWLAGCAAVGPDYHRPAVELPAQYGPAAPETTLAAEPAVIPTWWTLFNDAELNRLVTLALERNSDIAQAVARVEQADAVLREAGTALIPEVDLGAAAARSRSSGAFAYSQPPGGFVGNSLQLALSTSFELDFWGRLRRGVEAARAQALASVDARDVTRLSIAGLTAQTWFALRSLDEQVALTRETLATREDGLRISRARLDAGTISRLEVEQADGLRADAAVQLRDLTRQRALAQTQLALLTVQPNLVIEASDARTAVVPPVPPVGLPSSLLERRPDLKQAERLLVAANAQIGVARAALFPTISLTGNYGGQSDALSTLLDGPARIWSLGFGLSLPIFDGGRLSSRVDQASARQKEAVGAYQAAISTAFKEVADALENGRAAADAQADYERRVSTANEALRLAKMRYDAGYSAYLDLLDAQRTANAARLDQARNRLAQLNASVELYKALGGGWQTDERR